MERETLKLKKKKNTRVGAAYNEQSSRGRGGETQEMEAREGTGEKRDIKVTVGGKK